MMFVRNYPTAVAFAQTDGQPQLVVGVGREIFGCAAAQQRVSERDVGTRRHVQLDDLEASALALPLEERWPAVPICVEPRTPSNGGSTSNITI